MRIAGKLTVKDWNELSKILTINQQEHWDTATHFFEERIKTRYLNAILAILKMKEYNGEGFAVVNLQCSLIETLESYKNGWVYSNEKKDGYLKNKWHYNKIVAKTEAKQDLQNKDIFISFFTNSETFKHMGIDGEDFFKNVRCALLHETQTKNNWRIKKCSSATQSYCESPAAKIIYRDQFQKNLEDVIDNYKNALIKGEKFNDILAKDLRENYIAKFNHLCKQ